MGEVFFEIPYFDLFTMPKYVFYFKYSALRGYNSKKYCLLKKQ